MLKSKLTPPLRLALVYLIVSILWILLSDQLLAFLIKEHALLSTLQTVKGWAFVTLTAVLIYRLAKREMRQLAEKNRELEAWGHRLEERVAERTLELSTSNRRLENLDNLKSKIISEISHELRSPITSIGLKIELMERVEPSRRMQYITELKEQVMLLRQLLNDMTDLAVLEDTSPHERTQVDLVQLMRRVIDVHQPLADVTGLSLAYEVVNAVPAVLGYYNQLARMMNNLVTNAIKYTEQGEIHVKVFADTAQKEVIIQVQDTGIGIDERVMPHIFERSFRGERVKERNIPGSGLGLSIVKDIVEKHRGSITVESVVNVGSTFRVSLPVDTAQPNG